MEEEKWRCEHSDAPLLQKIITQKEEREKGLLSHSAINAATASQTDSMSCLCLSAVRFFRLVFLSYTILLLQRTCSKVARKVTKS